MTTGRLLRYEGRGHAGAEPHTEQRRHHDDCSSDGGPEAEAIHPQPVDTPPNAIHSDPVGRSP